MPRGLLAAALFCRDFVAPARAANPLRFDRENRSPRTEARRAAWLGLFHDVTERGIKSHAGFWAEESVAACTMESLTAELGVRQTGARGFG